MRLKWLNDRGGRSIEILKRSLVFGPKHVHIFEVQIDRASQRLERGTEVVSGDDIVEHIPSHVGLGRAEVRGGRR